MYVHISTVRLWCNMEMATFAKYSSSPEKAELKTVSSGWGQGFGFGDSTYLGFRD